MTITHFLQHFSINSTPSHRPPLQFQRQQSSVQVEIPIDNDQNPCNSSDEATTSSTCIGYLGHPSPTSSQTITTIASINRPDESNALSNCDVSSLIRLNGSDSFRQQQQQHESDNTDIVGIHIALNNGNNCSRASRFSNDSSRCKSFSDRHNVCIKESHDHHQHRPYDTSSDARECKNVNISTELNKALMSTPHLSTTHALTLPRNVSTRANLHDRCEMAIR